MRAVSFLGMLLAPTLAVPATAQPPTYVVDVAAIVTQVARTVGIPERWIWSVMRVESAGRVCAVSRAGAMGLMQLMPGTWGDMRARLHLGNDPFDPYDNVLAGAAYLRAMHDRYGEPGFLAAYNAGPARYEDYLSHRLPLPMETTGYVARLAPVIGISGLPDPFALSRASLFVRQPEAGSLMPAAQGKAGLAADGPPPDRLFVRVSSSVQPQ